MSEEQSEWNSVDVPEKVEFEIEEKEEVKEPRPEVKAEQPQPEAPQENIKELDGIETNGAQKRIRQLVKQRKERDEQIQQLIQEREALSHQLQTREKSFVDTQKITTDNSEKHLLEKVNLAKSNYLEAYNAGDGEKVLQSLEVLQRVQMDLDNVNKQKVAIDNYNKEMEQRAAVQQQQPQQIQQQPDVKAQSWAEDNDWFGQDSVMTASALAVDAELKQMGYDPNDDQFYTEIDRRMRTEFPHKFQEDQQEEREQPTKQVAQVVAGTSRSPASSNKKVKLSQEDVRLASKWNIPLEVYAAEKLKVDSSDGEYTNINYRGS